MKRSFVYLVILSLLLCTGCRPSAPQSAGAQETTQMETTLPETTAPQATEARVYIEFSREGEVTRVPVEMVTGTQGHYTIGYDPERFTHNGDAFLDHVWGNRAPVVFYSVSYFPDMTALALEEGLQLQNDGDYAAVEAEDTRIGNYSARGLYYSSDDSLGTQHHFYMIDSPYGGSYLLETQFILEMYEGLYPQIRAAMDTFAILG